MLREGSGPRAAARALRPALVKPMPSEVVTARELPAGVKDIFSAWRPGFIPLGRRIRWVFEPAASTAEVRERTRRPLTS